MSKVQKRIDLESGISFELILKNEKLDYEDKLKLYDLYVKNSNGIELSQKDKEFFEQVVNKNSLQLIVQREKKEVKLDIEISEIFDLQMFFNDVFNDILTHGKGITDLAMKLNLENQISSDDKSDIMKQYAEVTPSS